MALKDIGPNPHLNKLASALIASLSLPPLYFGLDSLQFLRPEERGLSFALLGVAGLILVWATWLWLRRPMNAARITFQDQGFRLETRQVFRGEKVFDLSWGEITEITKTDAGLYGGRLIRVHRGDGVEPARFSPAWTETNIIQIIDALETSAEAAGYRLEKETGFWRGLLRERWVVVRS